MKIFLKILDIRHRVMSNEIHRQTPFRTKRLRHKSLAIPEMNPFGLTMIKGIRHIRHKPLIPQMRILHNQQMLRLDFSTSSSIRSKTHGRNPQFSSTIMIEFITFYINTDKFRPRNVCSHKFFLCKIKLTSPRMRHTFKFHRSLQTSCRSLGKTTIHPKLRFRRNMFEREIPFARPKFAVETSWHNRKDNAVCILDVLFQKKTLVLREKVLATMSFAMNACGGNKSVRLKQGRGGWGVQIVTSHGSANFQKMTGSKSEAIWRYSVGSLSDFGHACIMSWTG